MATAHVRASAEQLDPDQMFSSLPQPYRMICKIIELEILDACWLEITRKHPELQLGSDGQPILIKRNYALNTVLTPSDEPQPSPLLTSIRCEASLTLGTTLTGDLLALDSSTNLILSTLSILPDDSFGTVAVSSPAWVASTALNKVTNTVYVCTAVIFQPSPSAEAVAAAAAAAAGGGKKGGGAAPKKGAVVEEVKVEEKKKVKLVVASMPVNTNVFYSPPVLSLLDTIIIDVDLIEDEGTITVDMDTADNLLLVTSHSIGCLVFSIPPPTSSSSNPDTISEEVSEAKLDKDMIPIPMKAMAVMPAAEFFGNKKIKAGFFVSTGPGVDIPIPGIGLINTAGVGVEGNNNGNSGKTPTAAVSSGSLAQPSGVGSSSSLVGAAAAGGGGAAAGGGGGGSGGTVSVDTMMNTLKKIFVLQSYEIAIMFEESRQWSLIDLHPPPPPKPQAAPVAAAAPPAKGAKPAAAAAPAGGGKGGKGVVEPPPAPTTNPLAFHCSIIATWNLPTKITSCEVDSRRVNLLLGFQDGTVTLWDMPSRSFTSVLCQHTGPVTALLFGSPGVTTDPWYLISGAQDGTVCFHTKHPIAYTTSGVESAAYLQSILPPITLNSSPENRSLNSAAARAQAKDVSTSKLTFRNDVGESAVVSIRAAPVVSGFRYPVCFVEYADETLAAYDYETQLLLGQLKYKIQRGMNDLAWHPACVSDVLQTASNMDKAAAARAAAEAAEARRRERRGEEEDEEEEEGGTHTHLPPGAAAGAAAEGEHEDATADTSVLPSAITSRSLLRSVSRRYLCREDSSDSLTAGPRAASASSKTSARRSSKHNPTPTVRHAPFLSTITAAGVSVVYVQDPRDTLQLAFFSVEKAMQLFYPALTQMYSEEHRDWLSVYFSLLTTAERQQSMLSRDRVAEIMLAAESRCAGIPGKKGLVGAGNLHTTGTRATRKNRISSAVSGSTTASTVAGSSSGGGGGVPGSSSGLGGSRSASRMGTAVGLESAGYVPVKPWAIEGKDAVVPSSGDSVSTARSDGSGSVTAALPAMKAAAAGVTVSVYSNVNSAVAQAILNPEITFDPVSMTRRAVAKHILSKSQRNKSTATAVGSATITTLNHSSSSLTAGGGGGGGGGPPTAGGGHRGDRVLNLLNGLATQFEAMNSSSANVP